MNDESQRVEHFPKIYGGVIPGDFACFDKFYSFETVDQLKQCPELQKIQSVFFSIVNMLEHGKPVRLFRTSRMVTTKVFDELFDRFPDIDGLSDFQIQDPEYQRVVIQVADWREILCLISSDKLPDTWPQPEPKSVEMTHKLALMEALIVNGIYQAEHETDPKKAVHDLITQEVRIALDPAVSKEAQELIRKGSSEECLWHEDACGIFYFQCGNPIEFQDNCYPIEGWKFCPYCGKRTGAYNQEDSNGQE